ncbi:uncharacterized protein VTP21DRAFT_5081 [Calcarisporiella thermophila]|uniref:uncharacterized protein n=1 Tax=Calcarisporiella thermophila TaxID=911321 RepID=UPI00374245EB
MHNKNSRTLSASLQFSAKNLLPICSHFSRWSLSASVIQSGSDSFCNRHARCSSTRNSKRQTSPSRHYPINA